jgi:GH15 family glucan-1,4-alpha-glucosidase
MIKPMANFMAEFIDETTGLPKPSYDLWEERFMINTHTVAVTYGALVAAAELASVTGDEQNAVKWRTAADDIQVAAKKYLFNKERQVVYRGLSVNNGEITYDATIDTAAVYSSFMFGLFGADSHEVDASIATTAKVFNTSKLIPGLPRYENDEYRRANPEADGNWWYITTLWQAQYDIEKGNTENATAIIDWVHAHMLSTGMMGEQIDPLTEEVIAPAPLTWSHAEYLGTLIDLLGRER